VDEFKKILELVQQWWSVILPALFALFALYHRHVTKENRRVIGNVFRETVAGLSSSNLEVRMSSAVLLRRFFDKRSELGVGGAPYAKDAVDVIAAVLKTLQTSNFQKVLADGIRFAPAYCLQNADLQGVNFSKAFLSKQISREYEEFLNPFLSIQGARERKDYLVRFCEICAEEWPRFLKDFQCEKGFRERIVFSMIFLIRSAGVCVNALKSLFMKHEEINMEGADFFQADLSGAQLKKAILNYAQFYEATLYETKFNDAQLKEANFSGATLHSVDFSGADLTGANFEGAILREVNFTNAKYCDAIFTNSNGYAVKCPPVDLNEWMPLEGCNVFISRPGVLDTRQQLFLDSVKDILVLNEYRPIELVRGKYDKKNVVGSLVSEVEKCSAMIAFGFRSTHIIEGVYRYSTEDTRIINGEYLSTPWNHVEVGIAMSQKKPVLMLVDEGINDGTFASNIEDKLLARISIKTCLKKENINVLKWLQGVGKSN